MSTGFLHTWRPATVFGVSLLLASATLFLSTESALADDQAKSLVKLTASGGKIEPDGQQKVVIKMEIASGWHAYANPVKNDDLVDVQTQVKVAGVQKLADTKIAYPAGRQMKVGNDAFEVYEGNLEIIATVKRAAGDTSPLDFTVTYSVCNDSSCLPPETVKLQVK